MKSGTNKRKTEQKQTTEVNREQKDSKASSQVKKDRSCINVKLLHVSSALLLLFIPPTYFYCLLYVVLFTSLTYHPFSHLLCLCCLPSGRSLQQDALHREVLLNKRHIWQKVIYDIFTHFCIWKHIRTFHLSICSVGLYHSSLVCCVPCKRLFYWISLHDVL